MGYQEDIYDGKTLKKSRENQYAGKKKSACQGV